MEIVRMRLTASEDDARDLINLLTSLDAIEHVEEVADLMPHMDDEDSSSAGLPDDMGPGTHAIEVHAPNREVARQIREVSKAATREMGGVLEIVDEF